MSISRTVIPTFVALALTACSPTATVGASPLVSVPRDSPQQCARFCTDMSMTLASVVVIDNTVGCVCNPPGPAPQASAGAPLAAAMAVRRAEQEAAQAPTPAMTTPPPPR